MVKHGIFRMRIGDSWIIYIYQAIWVASYGETFNCVREASNIFDPFTVVVVKDGEIIGHIPRLISASFHCFYDTAVRLSAK